MSAGGEHTNGIVGDDLSSSFERGCCLDGFTGVSAAPIAPLGKPEPATPSRPSGRVSTDAWQPIATAPKDRTLILAYALGADGRPLIAIVHWTDRATMWSSAAHPFDPASPTCEWIGGEMGCRYGVPFTHWMPLPTPPKAEGR